MTNKTQDTSLRSDLTAIADLIETGSRVLDVGCGDGELLYHLYRQKNVDGRGIELSQTGVNACVAKGLSVIQGDADTDLIDYPDGAFQVAVLSQTLQATKNPKGVLMDLLRISDRVIVSFPNFGNWRVRLSLLIGGRMPITRSLNKTWYSTPNIHLCTIRDFLDLCDEFGAIVERAFSISADGHVKPISHHARRANLFGEQAVFLLRRKS